MVRIRALLTGLLVMGSAHSWAQSTGAQAPGTQTLTISRAGSRAVQSAPEANFTGDVRVERLYEALDPSHSSGGVVTFAPGARTAWHSHPGGQILIVTAGTGRVQIWGQPIEEIGAGDVVNIPAGVKHWHGASPNASMTHLGITEQRDGTAVRWMEKVSDEQYNAAVAAPEPLPQASPQPSGPSSRLRPPIVGRARRAVGRTPATDRARTGDAHRRRAVRRRVERARVVTTRSQSGDHLCFNRDRKNGAPCHPPGSSPDQRRQAERGLRSSGASRDLLWLAERRRGAGALRAGLQRAKG